MEFVPLDVVEKYKLRESFLYFVPFMVQKYIKNPQFGLLYPIADLDV
jgi:hypothetical protein